MIPSWAAHEHANASAEERALLFSVHDTPLLEAVDKYRSEPVPQQEVVGSFNTEA